MTVTQAPRNRHGTVKEAADETARLSRLGGVSKHIVDLNKDLRTQIEEEMREGIRAKGMGVFSRNADRWCSSATNAVYGGGKPRQYREFYNGKFTVAFMEGNQDATVIVGDNTTADANLAGEFVLARYLDPKAQKLPDTTEGGRVLERYHRRRTGVYQGIDWDDDMSLVWADAGKKKLLAVLMQSRVPNGPWVIRQRYDLTDGKVVNGKASFKKADRVCYFSDGKTLASTMSYVPIREVPDAKVDDELGIPMEAMIVDQRLGTDKEFSYHWPGHLPDEAELLALYAKDQADRDVSKLQTSTSSTMAPAYLGVAMLGLGGYVALGGRRKKKTSTEG